MSKLCLGLLLCFYTQLCSAVIISEWDLDGNADNESFVAALNSVTNVTGLNLSRGSGLTPRTSSNSFNSGNWHNLESGDYLSLGFNVANGFAVDLSNLEIALRASNTGPGFLSLFYSGDGFSNSLATFTQSGDAVNYQDIDLSSLQHLTGQVEFRIQAASTVSANGGTISSQGTLRILESANSNVMFNGVVTTVAAVPEPQSYLMLMVGLAALGLKLVRQQKSA